MSNNIPRLTGGILFGLILEARKLRTRVRSREVDKNDGLTEVDIMLSFLEIFIGEPQQKPQGTSFKKNVSQYKKCDISTTTYLPFDDKTIIDLFEGSVEQNKKDTLNRMSEFISDKFSEQKLQWFVSAIIETIRDDKTIDVSQRFKVSTNVTVCKSELSSISTVEIEPFLLDVMRYIFVNQIENTLGKSTFKDWYSQSRDNTPWKFSNEELGKSLQSLKISRYNINVEEAEKQEDTTKEQEYFEEIVSDDEREQDYNNKSAESITKQVFNNPKVINQYANNIYNIEHVENLN